LKVQPTGELSSEVHFHFGLFDVNKDKPGEGDGDNRQDRVRGIEDLSALEVHGSVGHEHHQAADDVKTLGKADQIPGPGGEGFTHQELEDSDQGEDSQDDRQPPFLRGNDKGTGGEEHKGEKLEDQDSDDSRFFVEEFTGHKGLPKRLNTQI
jgi:hypothetical protein